MALKITMDSAKKLTRGLVSELKTYKANKKPLEEQMMKDLRQYRAVYDPDVQKRLENLRNRSKAYPRDTRVKVIGYVSKMMELMFPTSGTNFTIQPSAIPSIEEKDIDSIITTLEEQSAASGQPITSDLIESAVFDFAKKRAENMQKQCVDQLQNSDVPFPELSKRTLRSGAIYSYGVSKGPMVEFSTERRWELNEFNQWRPTKKETPYPTYANISSWNVFPDLTAATWEDQEAVFERLLFSRYRLEQLIGREGFDSEAIKKHLRNNPSGNYTPSENQQELETLNHNDNSQTNKKERQYEIYSFRGFVTAHMLKDIGEEVAEDDMHLQQLVEIWFMEDGTLVKLDPTPFGNKPSDFYHAYIHGADEDSGILGVSLPQDVRNSQMGICATSRQLQDNAAAVAGPVFEVNKDLIDQGKDIGAIHAFKVIYRRGMGNEATTQAVRQLSTDSHITELLALLDTHRATMDIESSMPAWLFGAAQPLGEAFRTSQNFSAMQGGATMVFKDHVRAFDNYVRSIVRSLIEWNQEFNDREDIKGDFHPQPGGNASLVSRELRGAALDQFWLSLSEVERAMFDQYEIMKERLIARDLPAEYLKPRTAAEAAVRQAQEAAAQAAQIQSADVQAGTQKKLAEAEKLKGELQIGAQKLPVEIQEAFARIQQMLATAKAAGDAQRVQMIELMLNSIPNLGGGGGGGGGGQQTPQAGPSAGEPEPEAAPGEGPVL